MTADQLAAKRAALLRGALGAGAGNIVVSAPDLAAVLTNDPDPDPDHSETTPTVTPDDGARAGDP